MRQGREGQVVEAGYGGRGGAEGQSGCMAARWGGDEGQGGCGAGPRVWAVGGGAGRGGEDDDGAGVTGRLEGIV